MPYLTGRNDARPHDVLFWRLQQKSAVRVGDWKLVRNPRRRSNADWHLYNLAEDIGEAHDLAGQHPDRVKALMAIWTRLDEEMIEPVWSPSR